MSSEPRQLHWIPPPSRQWRHSPRSCSKPPSTLGLKQASNGILPPPRSRCLRHSRQKIFRGKAVPFLEGQHSAVHTANPSRCTVARLGIPKGTNSPSLLTTAQRRMLQQWQVRCVSLKRSSVRSTRSATKSGWLLIGSIFLQARRRIDGTICRFKSSVATPLRNRLSQQLVVICRAVRSIP